MASGFWPLASGSLFPFGVIAVPPLRNEVIRNLLKNR